MRGTVLLVALSLVACANTPPAPDWQLNAQGAMERALQAYLSGDQRLEALEFSKARSEVAKTGRVDLVARTELLRCAAQVASLVFEDCPGFAVLAADAPAAERAYADYLAGRVAARDVELLPAPQRVMAGAAASTDALVSITDPLSQLVAAGVLMRTGRADPMVIAVAIDTASAQGWRRPLLAWLGVQAQRADLAGDTVEAARIRRRMALAGETVPRAP